jgi:hypothetical protein
MHTNEEYKTGKNEDKKNGFEESLGVRGKKKYNDHANVFQLSTTLAEIL